MPLTPTITPAPDLLDLDGTFLPVGQMRQITRVTALEGPCIHGEVELGSEHWVYAQHFPDDPIFPGTLMIEAAGQLVALWAWAAGHRGRPRLVRTRAAFHRPVTAPTPRLELLAEVRGKRHLQFGNVELSPSSSTWPRSRWCWPCSHRPGEKEQPEKASGLQRSKRCSAWEIQSSTRCRCLTGLGTAPDHRRPAEPPRPPHQHGLERQAQPEQRLVHRRDAMRPALTQHLDVGRQHGQEQHHEPESCGLTPSRYEHAYSSRDFGHPTHRDERCGRWKVGRDDGPVVGRDHEVQNASEDEHHPECGAGHLQSCHVLLEPRARTCDHSVCG